MLCFWREPNISDSIRLNNLALGGFHSQCATALELFRFWTDSAREMVVAWILCAKRLKLNKDVRQVISILLWETRKEALHKVSNKE